MSTRGYNIIKEEFFSKSGLRHDRKQFKNRWTQCKNMYSFWLFLNSQSGLGRRTYGTIVASESFWKIHTEKCTECRKFQYGVPTYMDHLAEMFHGIVVDGSSSCIPGDAHGRQQEICDEEQGEDEYGERFLNSSTPSSGRKRCSSTTDTTSSPPKKPKPTMSKMFEGLITEMQTARNEDTEVFNQIKNYQLEKDSSDMDDFSICLSLAEESCNAPNFAVEFFLFFTRQNSGVTFSFSFSPR